MTYSSPFARPTGAQLRPPAARTRDRARPLPPGIGLAAGAAASLALWAGLVHMVLWLVG